MTQVLTVANRIPVEDYYLYREFKASLKKFDCKPLKLGWDQPWGGLMTKPRKYREWLRANNSEEPVILCDAWDVIFAASPDDIVKLYQEKWGRDDCRIVWNAERNCFPDPDLAAQFPETSSTFRYLNSGFAVGRACDFLRMFEEMNLDEIPDDYVDEQGVNIGPNDQLYIQQFFLKNLDWMKLDDTCDLCQTLHDVKSKELDLTGERIINKETGSAPLVFHANGGGKQMIGPVLSHLKLR